MKKEYYYLIYFVIWTEEEIDKFLIEQEKVRKQKNKIKDLYYEGCPYISFLKIKTNISSLQNKEESEIIDVILKQKNFNRQIRKIISVMPI